MKLQDNHRTFKAFSSNRINPNTVFKSTIKLQCFISRPYKTYGCTFFMFTVYEGCGESAEQFKDRPEGYNPVRGRGETEPPGLLRSRAVRNQLCRLPGRGDTLTPIQKQTKYMQTHLSEQSQKYEVTNTQLQTGHTKTVHEWKLKGTRTQIQKKNKWAENTRTDKYIHLVSKYDLSKNDRIKAKLMFVIF